jgi:hypothetical protein
VNRGGSDRLELVLFADHNQFYVVDDAPGGDADAADEELWDRAALEEHLAVHPGSLAVLTATYGPVKVVLERLDGPPDGDREDSDHVVEAPLSVRSGRITVLEETTPRGTLVVPPVSYGARVTWTGVGDAEQMDSMPDDPVETILIQLWPGAAGERTVLKWYRNWKPSDERPTNPYGLRVLVGRECDQLRATRIVGDPKDAEEFDDRSLVRDADGVHWLQFYSDRPPYSEVMLELPESALQDFTLWPQPPQVELDEEHVRRTIALPAAERYRYFVERVASSGWLWMLEGVEWQYEDGRSCALVWPHLRFAEVYSEQEQLDSRPEDHELASWLDTLERHHDLVAVFPTSLFDGGEIVPAGALAEALRR